MDHNILLGKLNHYGIRGVPLRWFTSYLTNRKQFVSIEENRSDTKSVTIGVPQGSILGPLLFVIYINDLHVAIKNCEVYHFADDTNLQLITNSLNKPTLTNKTTTP